jgi:hypothetical protein
VNKLIEGESIIIDMSDFFEIMRRHMAGKPMTIKEIKAIELKKLENPKTITGPDGRVV